MQTQLCKRPEIRMMSITSENREQIASEILKLIRFYIMLPASCSLPPRLSTFPF